MMQQCNVIKSRIASGAGLTDSMTAIVPACERLLGTSLQGKTTPSTPAGSRM